MNRGLGRVLILAMGLSLFWAAHPAVAAVVLSSFDATANNPPGEVTLKWKTASEINTAGFNLYRSEHTGGPYARINAQLIRTNAEPLTGGSYEYTDRGVTAGQTYYYQLEELEVNGTSTRFPPIQVSVPSGAAPVSAWLGAAAAALLIAGGGLWALNRRRAARTAG